MEKRLISLIEGIGFNAKEAEVYLACLESGDATNTRIVQKTKLNRITNYEVLKRLERRGIIASFLKRGVKHFFAIDPRIVIRQAKERVTSTEQALPELLSVANQLRKKPRIYFFEGIDGIKAMYENSLHAKREILTFTSPKDIRHLLGDDFVDRYVTERVRRNIAVRGLASNDEFGEKEKIIGSKVLREVRLFSKDRYKIYNEVMLYDDTMAIFSGHDEVGVIIENKDLVTTFKNIWQMAWDNARNE